MTQLEAKRINNIAFLKPTVGLWFRIAVGWWRALWSKKGHKFIASVQVAEKPLWESSFTHVEGAALDAFGPSLAVRSGWWAGVHVGGFLFARLE